jgi:hypothetical protein
MPAGSSSPDSATATRQGSRALTALELSRSGNADAQATPDWLPRLLELEPYRVAFGHDRAVWQPGP